MDVAGLVVGVASLAVTVPDWLKGYYVVEKVLRGSFGPEAKLFLAQLKMQCATLESWSEA